MRRFLAGLLLSAAVASAARAQTPAPPPAQTPSTPVPRAPSAMEQGIPIPDKTVQTSCGACHRTDANQVMSRISFQRNTPEGWQETVRRMAALNGLKIEPATAREIVKYLSNQLGLAPDETKPAAFELERRIIDYKYADKDTESVCAKCHSMGRVMLQRRTKEEWELLINMHRGWYPLVDAQAFRRTGPPQREPGPDGRPPDNRHPVEKALEHLTKTFPLHTPEWAAWSANVRAPRLDGAWAITGTQPGKGPIVGRVTVTANPSTADEFETAITYTYVRGGATVTRKGRSIVYTGYQWRGRSTEGGNDATSVREVMFVDRDWRSMSGRWFSGGYDEIGMDVRLRRLGAEPVVLAIDRPSVRRPATAVPIKIHGANLPSSIAPGDVDFGRGVRVTRVVSSTPDVVTVEADFAADAPVGPRDLFVAGVASPAALVVYDRIDTIRVQPQANMARVGGVVFPKMLAQFEAVAFSNGPDGKPDTKDDLNLGIVDAAWSLEEYSATLNDEDLKYVGSIDRTTGLFTPNVEGPNPQRPGNANNVGDVWVVATVNAEGGSGAASRPLRARAHLLVTVPLYMRWNASGSP
jgi:quinohemoprotein amine dehydrogenase